MVASSGAVLALVGVVWGVSVLAPQASTPNGPIAMNQASEQSGSQALPTPTREEIERELADIKRAARAMNHQLQRLAKVERMSSVLLILAGVIVKLWKSAGMTSRSNHPT